VTIYIRFASGGFREISAKTIKDLEAELKRRQIQKENAAMEAHRKRKFMDMGKAETKEGKRRKKNTNTTEKTPQGHSKDYDSGPDGGEDGSGPPADSNDEGMDGEDGGGEGDNERDDERGMCTSLNTQCEGVAFQRLSDLLTSQETLDYDMEEDYLPPSSKALLQRLVNIHEPGLDEVEKLDELRETAQVLLVIISNFLK
jgi:hypothetical protein